MKTIKYSVILLFGLLLLTGACGCQEKVVTVAKIQDEEGQIIEYITMQEFERKDPVTEQPKERIRHCAVLIPKGYFPSAEIPGLYVHERSPMESSNIYYSVAQGESGVVSEELTADIYKKTIEDAYAQKGSNISLEILSFEKTDMDGVPAYKIRSSHKKESNTILQLTYMILAEDTHMITYSQSKDDEMMVDFETSEGQIRLIREEKDN